MTSQRVLSVGNVAGGSKPAAFITAAEPLTPYTNHRLVSVPLNTYLLVHRTYTPELGLPQVRCSDSVSGSSRVLPLAFTPYAPGLPDDERTLGRGADGAAARPCSCVACVPGHRSCVAFN